MLYICTVPRLQLLRHWARWVRATPLDWRCTPASPPSSRYRSLERRSRTSPGSGTASSFQIRRGSQRRHFTTWLRWRWTALNVRTPELTTSSWRTTAEKLRLPSRSRSLVSVARFYLCLPLCEFLCMSVRFVRLRDCIYFRLGARLVLTKVRGHCRGLKVSANFIHYMYQIRRLHLHQSISETLRGRI